MRTSYFNEESEAVDIRDVQAPSDDRLSVGGFDPLLGGGMPLYAAALRELNAFNEASLKVARDSGLIDQAAYDLMKDQPYVPFYRLMEEDGGMRGPRRSKA